MIDHLIVATPTEATVADLGARLGVVLAPGGRHLGLDTARSDDRRPER